MISSEYRNIKLMICKLDVCNKEDSLDHVLNSIGMYGVYYN